MIVYKKGRGLCVFLKTTFLSSIVNPSFDLYLLE